MVIPLYKLEFFPCTEWCFVPSLVDIESVVLKKKLKMWKVYGDDDYNNRQRKKKCSEKLTRAFGSGELKNYKLIEYCGNKQFLFQNYPFRILTNVGYNLSDLFNVLNHTIKGYTYFSLFSCSKKQIFPKSNCTCANL